MMQTIINILQILISFQYSTLNLDYYVRHCAIQVHLWGKLYSSSPCTWAVVNIQHPYLICGVYFHPARDVLWICKLWSWFVVYIHILHLACFVNPHSVFYMLCISTSFTYLHVVYILTEYPLCCIYPHPVPDMSCNVCVYTPCTRCLLLTLTLYLTYCVIYTLHLTCCVYLHTVPEMLSMRSPFT